MKTATRNQFGIEGDSFNTISLFMSWYLRKERLAQDENLKCCMKEINQREAFELGQWADLTRQTLLQSSQDSLRAVLEKPLQESERLLVAALVERFIEGYGVYRLRIK